MSYEPPQPQRELQPILPPDEPWTHCGIDLVCELPANSTGFRKILVVVCYLTKFVAARAIKTKTTREVLNKKWLLVLVAARAITSKTTREVLNKKWLLVLVAARAIKSKTTREVLNKKWLLVLLSLGLREKY